jgi:hypothetical protein
MTLTSMAIGQSSASGTTAPTEVNAVDSKYLIDEAQYVDQAEGARFQK